MASTLGELFSAIFQILLFTLIPFIWWLITARKKENFFSWIGLKKPVGNLRNILILMAIAFVVCEAVGQVINNTVMKADWNQSNFAGMGIAGIPCVIIYAYLHTAFSEEIIFRGFLQKRLQKQFGFIPGTIIQALIFGAVHVVLNLNYITPVQGVFLLLYPMIPAVFFAFINEKKCEGSILPGWLIHGTLNLITGISQL